MLCKVLTRDSWKGSCVRNIKICLCHGFQKPRLRATCQIGKPENHSCQAERWTTAVLRHFKLTKKRKVIWGHWDHPWEEWFLEILKTELGTVILDMYLTGGLTFLVPMGLFWQSLLSFVDSLKVPQKGRRNAIKHSEWIFQITFFWQLYVEAMIALTVVKCAW